MKELPILFNGDMVRAILDGRKTQTRRPLKQQPPENCHLFRFLPGPISWAEFENNTPPLAKWSVKCPFGRPGDRLWARETFTVLDIDGKQIPKGYAIYPEDRVIFDADFPANDPLMSLVKWRPSIHMPRWACRLILEVTDVRVERVQDISSSDITKEGLRKECHALWKCLWNSVYKNYNDNPWVWVVEFKVL